jgi:hypothetical protein
MRIAMKYIITITVLWLIAIVTTLLFVGKAEAFNYSGPVYFICMVGSIVTMRKALAK